MSLKGTAVPSIPMASEKNPKKPDHWEIKDAADTLTKAQEIKQNKHLMPHVIRHLNKKRKQVISSIQELKQHAQERTKQLQGQPSLLDDDMDEDMETKADKKKEGA